MFQQGIAALASQSTVRSIPVAATECRPATLVHVLPLRRSAQDIFSGGDLLVVVTPLAATAAVPSPTLLSGLFDLAPAEAKLAAALAAGRPMKLAAIDQKIQFSTARTYLEAIFRKTGTHRQGELVALIKSTLPLAI